MGDFNCAGMAAYASWRRWIVAGMIFGVQGACASEWRRSLAWRLAPIVGLRHSESRRVSAAIHADRSRSGPRFRRRADISSEPQSENFMRVTIL